MATEDAWLWLAPAQSEPGLHLRFARRRLAEVEDLAKQVIVDSGGVHYQPLPGDANSLCSRSVLCLRQGRDGAMWIGTWGGGLSMLDTRTFEFRNYTTQDGLPGNFILALKEGPGGDLWIGGNGGLSRFDGGRFQNFARINGLAGGFIFSIEFGAGHSLWLGGHEALDRLTLDPETGEPLSLD